MDGARYRSFTDFLSLSLSLQITRLISKSEERSGISRRRVHRMAHHR
jgi:hypothetical protein